MAIQRILKKSICTSEDINALSFFEEVLFYRLIVNADDKGEQDGRPEIIRATCFPLKRDMTLSAIQRALTNMLTVGLVSITEEGGRPILRLTKWECHQRIRTTSATSAEKKKGDSEPLAANCGDSRRNAAQNEKETKKENFPPAPPYKENKKEKENVSALSNGGARACVCEGFVPPSLDEVRQYVALHTLSVDPDVWHSFYTSNGWTVGGAPMRDWQGCLKTWHHRGNKAKKPTKTTDGITEHSFDGDEFLNLAIKKGAEQ